MNRNRRTTVANQQRTVIQFNEQHPVGTMVEYWTGLRAGGGNYGKTRRPAEMLSGHTAVVWVTGHSGCIALTHVEVIDTVKKEGTADAV